MPRLVPVLVLGLVLGGARAGQLPGSLDELRRIEEQVEKVVAQATPAVVCIRVKNSTGSGVIVSKDGLVLTAGHVSGTPGQSVTLVLHDGKKVAGKALGRNTGMDSGMIRITDPGEWPFVEMGQSSALRVGQWCTVLAHPGGYRTGRAPVVRLGRLLQVGRGELVSDCTLVGGDSGGPLFDLAGRVIGINCRINKSITGNIHVPVDTFRETWGRLVQGDSWGDPRPGRIEARTEPREEPREEPRREEPREEREREAEGGYLGIQAKTGTNGATLTVVRAGSPADEAGLRVGDLVRKLDGRAVRSQAEMADHLGRKNPGDTVSLLIERDGEERTLKAVLGRPGTAPREPQPAATGGSLGVQAKVGIGGCQLTVVHPGSPADAVGLQVGDLIRKVDGSTILIPNQLAARVRQKNPGDSLDLLVQRDGKQMEVKGVLGRPGAGTPTPAVPATAAAGTKQPDLLGVRGNPDGRECVVFGLEPDSAARQAGLQVGDVIRRVDGTRVENVEELGEALAKKKAGDAVDVEFLRNGESITRRIVLGRDRSRP